MAGDPEADATRRIVHPVYLDVPMMTSFLAALRGGVAFEDTFLRREGSVATADRDLGGKIRLPALGSLLGLDASGRIGRKDQTEASEEVTTVRQHTTASLFNALYETLLEQQLLREIESGVDAEGIVTGDLVEVGGDFIGNPLEPVVAFAKQVAPYFDMTQEAAGRDESEVRALRAELASAQEEVSSLTSRASKANRSRNPAMHAQVAQLRSGADAARVRVKEIEGLIKMDEDEREELEAQRLGFRMLDQVGTDLATSPVHDTVINAGSLKVILTMAREFFGDAPRAYLRGGSFRAVGKVTRVLEEDGSINLLRRTVLGGVDPEIGRDLMLQASKDRTLQLDTFDPVIKMPAIQVLPLAVFT